MLSPGIVNFFAAIMQITGSQDKFINLFLNGFCNPKFSLLRQTQHSFWSIICFQFPQSKFQVWGFVQAGVHAWSCRLYELLIIGISCSFFVRLSSFRKIVLHFQSHPRNSKSYQNRDSILLSGLILEIQSTRNRKSIGMIYLHKCFLLL